MNETPLFSVVIKKPTILVDILYTMIGIVVWFMIGASLSAVLYELLSWGAVFVALAVGGFAFTLVLLLGFLVQRIWTRKLISDALRDIRHDGKRVVVKYDWLLTRSNDVWLVEPVQHCEVRFVSEKITWYASTTTYGLFPKVKELTPVN